MTTQGVEWISLTYRLLPIITRSFSTRVFLFKTLCNKDFHSTAVAGGLPWMPQVQPATAPLNKKATLSGGLEA
jgi:hypothetical protein